MSGESAEAADNHLLAKRAATSAVREAKTQVWEKFGEVIEKDFRLDSEKFWHSWEGQLLTQTRDVIRR